MANMKVISHGFLVTIQDMGRENCQQLGLSEAGAFDKHAFLWGNKLLGNDPGCAGLEILVGNSSFEFDASTTIAITGAEMGATLNGQPIENWSTTKVKAGDRLKFAIMQTGLRAYLTIKGGFQTNMFFASTSTMIREETGGNNGKKLQKDDLVSYEENANYLHRRVPKKWQPDYTKPLTLSITPSYNYEEFDKDSLARFLKEEYTVTNDADRMGYRLTGPALKRDGAGILSIGVPCGAIQIPPSGEPIILLNDRQCTGGYPIVGVVAARDIYSLAQRKSGDAIFFEIADFAERKAEFREFYQFFYQ